MKRCSNNQYRNIMMAYSCLEQICFEQDHNCSDCPLYVDAHLISSDRTKAHFDCLFKTASKKKEELFDYIESLVGSPIPRY